MEHPRQRKGNNMTDVPEKIYGVSQSQFSIARHYGGITFNGHYYEYNPVEDSLTLVKKTRKKKEKETT